MSTVGGGGGGGVGGDGVGNVPAPDSLSAHI